MLRKARDKQVVILAAIILLAMGLVAGLKMVDSFQRQSAERQDLSESFKPENLRNTKARP